MSYTPTLEYPSTTSTAHTDHETILAAAGGQPIATDISTGKKGLAGSIVAGGVIGGLVVVLLIVALFFGLRHQHRRSKGQTDPTMEAGPENETEKEKSAEASDNSHAPCSTCVAAYPSADAQSEITVYQARPTPSSPRKSFDSCQSNPSQPVYSNITTHAPRPVCYKTGQIIQNLDPSLPPCMSCALSPPITSRSTGAGTTTCSPGACSPGACSSSSGAYSSKEDYLTYGRRSCLTSTSPPLPPGAMPPLPSPTLESYGEPFKALPPPQSPPPQSPSSPGGSSIRRWIMSPLSRSGTVRTALPPYEPNSGSQQRESEKKEKDESALAASVYAFM